MRRLKDQPNEFTKFNLGQLDDKAADALVAAFFKHTDTVSADRVVLRRIGQQGDSKENTAATFDRFVGVLRRSLLQLQNGRNVSDAFLEAEGTVWNGLIDLEPVI